MGRRLTRAGLFSRPAILPTPRVPAGPASPPTSPSRGGEASRRALVSGRSAELPLDVEESSLWRDIAWGARFAVVAFVVYGAIALVMAVTP